MTNKWRTRFEPMPALFLNPLLLSIPNATSRRQLLNTSVSEMLNMHYFDLVLLTFCKALSILISGEEMGSERQPVPHHIELVTSGKAETLLQVGMTPGMWHGLARGQKAESGVEGQCYKCRN